MPNSAKPLRLFFGLFFGGISLLALGAGAEEARPMTIVDLLNIPLMNDPQLAPDGNEVLFVLAEADWKENKRIQQIWRGSRDGADPLQLTFGKKGASSPRWSPQGDWIAFVADRGDEDTSQIYLLPRRGGEGRPLTAHPTSVSDIAWAPDGKSLYFLATDEKTEEEKKKEEAQDDVFAFDEDYKQQHLWRVQLPEGTRGLGEVERVTAGDFTIHEYEISADGGQLVVLRAPTPLFDDTDEAEIWTLTAKGDSWLQLTKNRVYESGGTFSPDRSTVLFVAGANEAFEGYHNDNLFLVPAEGGAPRMLLPEMPTMSLPPAGPKTALRSISWPIPGFGPSSFGSRSPPETHAADLRRPCRGALALSSRTGGASGGHRRDSPARGPLVGQGWRRTPAGDASL